MSMSFRYSRGRIRSSPARDIRFLRLAISPTFVVKRGEIVVMQVKVLILFSDVSLDSTVPTLKLFIRPIEVAI